jgi:hypothetical protein
MVYTWGYLSRSCTTGDFSFSSENIIVFAYFDDLMVTIFLQMEPVTISNTEQRPAHPGITRPFLNAAQSKPMPIMLHLNAPSHMPFRRDSNFPFSSHCLLPAWPSIAFPEPPIASSYPSLSRHAPEAPFSVQRPNGDESWDPHEQNGQSRLGRVPCLALRPVHAETVQVVSTKRP